MQDLGALGGADGHEFQNLGMVWRALGGGSEQRRF